MFLSGCASASRLTRLSSVPIAQLDPAGAASMVLMMNSVEPTRSALSTTSCWHSGCTRICTSGIVARSSSTTSGEKRPCTEQWPFQRIIRASRSCSSVRPPLGRSGFQTTQSSSERPSLSTAVLRPRCWSGRKKHLGVGLLLERPLQRHLGVGRRADGAAVAAAERLDVGRGVHVGHRYDAVGDAGLGQRVPGVLDLVDPGHVGHRAAGRQVGQDHLLARAGQDVGRLGHEVHAAEDDELRLGPAGRVAGELERVAGDVGELDDLVALVVVAEHEHPVAQRLLGRAGSRHQVRVGGGRQVAGALDPALGGRVLALAEGEQREVDDGHGPIVFGAYRNVPWCRYGAGGFMLRSAR